VVTRRATESPTNGFAEKPQAVSSRLLPMLLESVEERERINVLDAGGASQGTIDFFGGYKARIHFVDLFSNELVVEPPEEIDPVSACAGFREYFDFPEELVFDVCLFWDVFHHMDLPVLEGFSRALAPYVDGRTLGYGFGSLHQGARAAERDRAPPPYFRYSIVDDGHLMLRPATLRGRYYSHTQQELDEFFPVLSIHRATLLREARLELLMAKP
jgi:SAM-dependent methyltransferase